ncbi:hypothetical protein RICGR_0287 [Rickettsiella grylli]|uniref:Uncharacterized protein n=1 Tax=Rickettsiella grylli TaxID=59196 RepID=A8PKB0_9COXI|nr:hypothetical protein RICGR_0287 [Rickettsiella grylli]
MSHFYHPTPPPRNPSGFWQRYENVFERRALIAEGRAAANSEVMHERLGNATANQQNDLDLGVCRECCSNASRLDSNVRSTCD